MMHDAVPRGITVLQVRYRYQYVAVGSIVDGTSVNGPKGDP